jgi:hypothetical protein
VPDNNGDAREKEGPLQGLKNAFAIAVAVIAIVGFGVLVAYLFADASSSSEQVWLRRVYLFGGVEAIVFAAVGWLFGREVNRQQAQEAQQRADESEKTARQESARAADLEARGKAMKAAIVSRRGTYSDNARVRSRGIGAESATAASSDMQELTDFANMLFPDR